MYDVTVAPWKIPFTATAVGPIAVKVKLKDLINDDGIRLPHDIIAYNTEIYDDNGYLKSEIPVADRAKYGIFFSRVLHDPRAPHVAHPNNPAYRYTEFQQSGIYYDYAEDSALDITQADFQAASNTFKLSTPSSGTPNDYYTTSVSVGLENETSSTTSLVVLKAIDKAFNPGLISVGKLPFSRFAVMDRSSGTSPEEFYNFISYFTGYGLDTTTWTFSGQDEDGAPLSSSDLTDPTKNPVFDTVEVWIRMAFFADYVDPASYMQDLTTESEVIHKNFIIGAGDFKPYETVDRDQNGVPVPPSTEITPYLPQVLPKLDYIHNVDLGFFSIPDYIDSTIENSTPSPNGPVGWFNQNIHTGTPGQNEVSVPKEGNAYIAGRIFSPTIDELWYSIKTLISGRSADAESDPMFGRPQAIDSLDTYYNSVPVLVPKEREISKQIGPYTRIIDPLTYDGSTYVNNANRQVNLLFNRNIEYVISKSTLNSINLTSEAAFIEWENSSDSVASRTRVSPGIQENDTNPTDWLLRDAPLSLRELEAYIKNVQFDLETVSNFVISKKATIGGIFTGGSLYQLHRDFSGDLDHIDTNTLNAHYIWTDSNDTEKPNESSEYGDNLPGTSGSYDRSIHQAKEDIYLAADGTWRYLFDQVRIPVISEIY
jgi:hypothetical protein